MIKALRNLRIVRMYLNIVKAIYDKPTTNIIFSGEELKPFSLKSGIVCSTYYWNFQPEQLGKKKK
jgi:hypothetical protein